MKPNGSRQEWTEQYWYTDDDIELSIYDNQFIMNVIIFGNFFGTYLFSIFFLIISDKYSEYFVVIFLVHKVIVLFLIEIIFKTYK